VESEEQLHDLELDIHRALLIRAARDTDLRRLGELWEGLPKSLREERSLLAVYVGLEVARGRGPLVVPALAESLRKSWDEELIGMLGSITTDQPAAQLAVAEPWLASHPSNPVLLLALGRLCIQASLWGKARSYLEASIGASPRPETYRELGGLMDRLGEQDKALECYRAGLALEIEDADARIEAGRLTLAPDGSGAKAIAAPVETFVRPGYSA
jgi:HemY protein